MTNPLFAFFGTPKFSTDVLDALEAHGFLPTLIVTAPDKAAGRGLATRPSPAKRWALERGIDVATPVTLKDASFIAELSNTDWDVFVTAAYAKLIPKAILDIPKRGCLNVHPSLLPKFRGPSPALSAILADERSTGITIMLMNEQMDAGPIVAQARIELEEEAPGRPGWPPKGSEFEKLLAVEGGNLLAEVLPLWVAGTITPEEQNSAEATYTKKFTDDDARLDLAGDPRTAYLKIRAFDAGPRPYFLTSAGKRVIATDATLDQGTLHITRVIPEGKKEMDYQDFLRGNSAATF